MENKDKLKQAVDLLKEWQEENVQHRAVVLSIAEEGTGLCGKVVYGTFKNLGFAFYNSYKKDAILRDVVSLAQKVYQANQGKEEENDDMEANILVRMVSEGCNSMSFGEDPVFGKCFSLKSVHRVKPLKGQVVKLEEDKSYGLDSIPLCPEFFDEQVIFTRVPKMAYTLGVEDWCKHVLREDGLVEPTGNIWYMGCDEKQSADRLEKNLFIVEVMINTSLTHPVPYYIPMVFKSQVCVSRMRPLEYVHELQQVLDLFHVHGTSHCGDLCDERDKLYFQYVDPPTIQFTFNYLKKK